MTWKLLLIVLKKRYIPSNGQLEVTLKVDNPKEKLELVSVKGDIEIPGLPDSQKTAEVDDVIFEEQTLFDGEYYLDNGVFDTFIPID